MLFPFPVNVAAHSTLMTKHRKKYGVSLYCRSCQSFDCNTVSEKISSVCSPWSSSSLIQKSICETLCGQMSLGNANPCSFLGKAWRQGTSTADNAKPGEGITSHMAKSGARALAAEASSARLLLLLLLLLGKQPSPIDGCLVLLY